MSLSNSIYKIHIISTINGQTNEGMRNVATHISKELEKNNKVCYSGLKNIFSIIKNCLFCNVTLIFARANKSVYWLCRLIEKLSKNVWLICVQKPDNDFSSLTSNNPLRINYLGLTQNDIEFIKTKDGYKKELFEIGINENKFKAIDKQKQEQLKIKYGFDPKEKLVVHVGHCSKGRGLEDFKEITNSQRMIVTSGLFENEDVLKTLEDSDIKIHNGYLENVEEIYQMADLYFFPTHSNEYVISIPLSVIEALSCGTPVVAYKDFENLNSITCKNGGITLINDSNELNDTIANLIHGKISDSYLTSTKTWKQVSEDLLTTIKENQYETRND